MNKTTKIFVAVICILITLTLCAACGPKAIKEWESNEINDDGNAYYKDYYQIFVYSFADGNGDGIGDLKGIEQKLDYIADLGFTGIWLSPVCTSPTYHKYDVTNYESIDSQFGSLADFKSLVQAAHGKGISVMMDMVFNHTSNQHPWFKASQKAYVDKDTGSKYYGYYTFLQEDGNKYATFGGYSHMPKLNLNNEFVRDEIEAICKFWLQDYGVDAFRLDAAYHYYSNASENVRFMQWLTGVAQKYNPDVYMVGEVWEHDTTVYSHYAENSVQSFFDFELSGADGYNKLFQIINEGVKDRAPLIRSVILAKEAGTARGIDALFASNHDTRRVSNLPLSYYSNRAQAFSQSFYEKHKMGIALLYTQTGNVFNYYGNEIGMRNGIRSFYEEDYVDQTYRIAMNWGNANVTDRKNGFAYGAYGAKTRFGAYDDYLGGVAEQKDDQNSLYNFYRRIMLLRRQNPEIARGTSSFVLYEDKNVSLLIRSYQDKKILLAYNLDDSASKTVDISKIIADNNLAGTLAGFLSSDNARDVTLKGPKLILPKFSIAVVR